FMFMRLPLEHGYSSQMIRAWIPSRRIEYVYYVLIVYGCLGTYFRLEVPLIGSGLTIILAAFCLRHLGSRAKQVLAPVGLLLACLISFILIQMAVYQASVRDMAGSILWICGIVIVQSLALRSGFLYRCAIALFLIGLIPLQSLTLGAANVDNDVQMAMLD